MGGNASPVHAVGAVNDHAGSAVPVASIDQAHTRPASAALPALLAGVGVAAVATGWNDRSA